jgi:CheY-like chemotaxis protein
MDGYTATDLIKRIDQNNYIIGFSANSLEKPEDLDERFWFDDFIKKPVELKLLYKKLLARFLKIKKGLYIQEEPELIPMENSPTRKDLNIQDYDLDDIESDHTQEIEYLNHEHAIKFYMGGNIEFYKKILSEFYQENQSIKLLDLTYSELKIKLHDLKSTSLTIGAEDLHIMVKQKYTDVKIIELEEIQEELDKVLSAIKNYL